MSRKAKAPIILPEGVEAKVEEDLVTVKGPKGKLSLEIKEKSIKVGVEEKKVSLALKEEKLKGCSHFLGLYWALISNLVHGVSKGFEKQLEMIGVGYRAAVQGKELHLQLGFSHPVKLQIPEGIEVEVQKNTVVFVRGMDFQKVGQFAADIRAKRPPEPYKGKGIRYKGEFVRKKAGKTGKK